MIPEATLGWFEMAGPDETAGRHGASAPEETQDETVAYARFGPAPRVRYRDGLLPDQCG